MSRRFKLFKKLGKPAQNEEEQEADLPDDSLQWQGWILNVVLNLGIGAKLLDSGMSAQSEGLYAMIAIILISPFILIPSFGLSTIYFALRKSPDDEWISFIMGNVLGTIGITVFGILVLV